MVKDERNIIRETLELTKEKVNDRVKAIVALNRSPMDFVPRTNALGEYTQDSFDLIRRYRRREMGK